MQYHAEMCKLVEKLLRLTASQGEMVTGQDGGGWGGGTPAGRRLRVCESENSY
jgi:hypothetical protein